MPASGSPSPHGSGATYRARGEEVGNQELRRAACPSWRVGPSIHLPNGSVGRRPRRHRLKKLEQAGTHELRQRRAILVEAHRKVRLLEKLRENRSADWQREFDREIEGIAADAFNSRFARDKLA